MSRLRNQPTAGSREALSFLNKLMIKDSVKDPKLKLEIENVIDALSKLRKGEEI